MKAYQFSFSLSIIFALFCFALPSNIDNSVVSENDTITFNQKLAKFNAAKDAVDFEALAKRSATDESAKQQIMEIVSILDGSSKEDLASVFELTEVSNSPCYWVTLFHFNCGACHQYHCGGRGRKICDALQVFHCGGSNTNLQRTVSNQGTCC